MVKWNRRSGQSALFRDRIDAGEQLAKRLQGWVGTGALVLGLPRGGVPVAAEVARALDAELDVLVARKVGAPSQPELAVGAVTADGGVFLDDRMIEHAGASPQAIEERVAAEQAEARHRDHRFRGHRPGPKVTARSVLLVDDGLATGATMRAAVHALRRHDPAEIIVAVPVGSRQACQSIAAGADQVVCLHTPEPFAAVGMFYEDFRPTEDAEVEQLLAAFHGGG